MAQPHEKKEFESWRRALEEDKLTPEQLATLQKMVDEGQAETLANAALLLDWQESVIDPDEHMYGH
jgi:hypothetical protein